MQCFTSVCYQLRLLPRSPGFTLLCISELACRHSAGITKTVSNEINAHSIVRENGMELFQNHFTCTHLTLQYSYTCTQYHHLTLTYLMSHTVANSCTYCKYVPVRRRCQSRCRNGDASSILLDFELASKIIASYTLGMGLCSTRCVSLNADHQEWTMMTTMII